MREPNDKELRKEFLELRNKSFENAIKAQEIVLKHLEDAIEKGDSATVAAMAKILEIC